MGWDAYALRHEDDVNSPEPHLDAEMRTIFEQANAELKRLVGDGGEIIDGELGGSLSRKCFMLATPIACCNESGLLCWPSDVVQKACSLANWDFRIEDEPYYNEDDSEAKWWILHAKCEARLFLETCSRHGYAILFT